VFAILPFPARVCSMCVLGDGRRRDWMRAQAIGRAIPQQTRQRAMQSQATIRPRAAEPRDRLALVCAEARGGGLEAVSLL
jgi:hypothetical protein